MRTPILPGPSLSEAYAKEIQRRSNALQLLFFPDSFLNRPRKAPDFTQELSEIDLRDFLDKENFIPPAEIYCYAGNDLVEVLDLTPIWDIKEMRETILDAINGHLCGLAITYKICY